jgi:hypothetical protein
MVALDESWPRRVGAICSITTEIVAAIFVSAFLTSLVIALRVSVACMTFTAGELWQIIVSGEESRRKPKSRRGRGDLFSAIQHPA